MYNDNISIEHEAKVSKVSEEQLFYLMSRGLEEQEATDMIVMGFIEPFTRELPMEYAVEMNRLISYEMEGSIGYYILIPFKSGTLFWYSQRRVYFGYNNSGCVKIFHNFFISQQNNIEIEVEVFLSSCFG